MKYTTLSSFQKNMGQKPKTQIKFVFMLIHLVIPPPPKFFFQRFKKKEVIYSN